MNKTATWLSEDVKQALHRPSRNKVSDRALVKALSNVIDSHNLWLSTDGAEGRQGYLVNGYIKRMMVARQNLAKIQAAHFSATSVDFRNCVFDGADLRSSNFKGKCSFFDCSFKNTDLSNATFTRAFFGRCDFTGAILDGAIFPQGFDPTKDTSGPYLR